MLEAEEQKPALRISHIVYGRENRGKRVYYLVDPQGKGEEKAIPENVVLKRWRKRQARREHEPALQAPAGARGADEARRLAQQLGSR